MYATKGLNPKYKIYWPIGTKFKARFSSDYYYVKFYEIEITSNLRTIHADGSYVYNYEIRTITGIPDCLNVAEILKHFYMDTELGRILHGD